MDGTSTASLGNLFQCFTTLMVKNFFLISNLNLTSFIYSHSPLSYHYTPLWKVPLHPSCRPPSGTGRLLQDHPRAFSSPGWTAPTLSACPNGRGTPALWSSSWPSSGPTPTYPCPSYTGGSRAGRSTPGGVSWGWSKGAESPPSTCWPLFSWCSPGYRWLSGLQAHTAGSCWASHPPVPPSPSLEDFSRAIFLIGEVL